MCFLAMMLGPSAEKVQVEFSIFWVTFQASQVVWSLQQDITRGSGMVDSVFQGFGATAGGGTHQAVLSSHEYLSQVCFLVFPTLTRELVLCGPMSSFSTSAHLRRLAHGIRFQHVFQLPTLLGLWFSCLQLLRMVSASKLCVTCPSCCLPFFSLHLLDTDAWILVPQSASTGGSAILR